MPGPEPTILWADEDLLAVNKPAGLPTLPDGWASGPHLRSVLEPRYGRLWIIHRLDRLTSGVVILARSAAAHRSLNMQFDAHQVAKCYHALVAGLPAWDHITVDLPLRADGDRRHRTVVDRRGGKPSLTELHVLERLDGFALIEAIPRTGRTHQIRTHLAAVGYPIAADALYGGSAAPRSPAGGPAPQSAETSRGAPMDRLALHARALTLCHPVSGKRLTFEAPYPDDLAAALRDLRRPA